eukprot:6179617-Pyramimonas_sp.AAC.1
MVHSCPRCSSRVVQEWFMMVQVVTRVVQVQFRTSSGPSRALFKCSSRLVQSGSACACPWLTAASAEVQ